MARVMAKRQMILPTGDVRSSYVSGARRVTAFTMVEVLVVMALVMLILGMSVPAMRQFGAHARLQGAAKTVTAMCLAAREYAITRRQLFTVYFEVETNPPRVWIQDADGQPVDRPYELPPGVKFGHPDDPELTVTFRDSRVVFRPIGDLEGSGGEIWISDRRGEVRRITVSKMAGHVRVENPSE